MCLYRVLQESLMNIAKHSGSAQAQASLWPARETSLNCAYATKVRDSPLTQKAAKVSA